eukprot:4578092-Pyramimonas_sp.AAC.1
MGDKRSKPQPSGRRWPPSSVSLFSETVENNVEENRPARAGPSHAEDACHSSERSLVQSLAGACVQPEQAKSKPGRSNAEIRRRIAERRRARREATGAQHRPAK